MISRTKICTETIDLSSRSGDRPNKAAFFADKVVVVTGGTSGIGRSLTEDLLTLGAYVTVCAHRDDEVARAQAEIGATFERFDACVCDVRHGSAVEALARRVLGRHGKVDILVNNAGYAVYRAFEESSAQEVCDIVDVNLSGAMRCTKAFLPGMIARRSGHIVNVSSIGGQMIITPNAAYCAAKHGVVAWTRALRYELARFNIQAGVVCPDFVPTGFQAHWSFRRRDPYRKSTKKGLTPAIVSHSIQDAIRTRRALTYVPSWAGWVVWVMRTLPFVVEPIWARAMQRRMEQLYREIAKESSAPNVDESRQRD